MTVLFSISEDSLRMLGLTQFHFHVILATLAILFLIAVLACLCQKFAVFKSVQFNVDSLRRCRIVYINHRGPYQNIGTIFKATQSVFSTYFKISKMFGIYYDNPKNMNDPKLSRSTIGLMVNQGEENKIQQFVNSFPSYRATALPKTNCLSTIYPFVNALSFLLIVGKVYPRLSEYIQAKRLQTAPAIMEIYHFLSQTNKSVQILAPLQNFQAFMLWEDYNQPMVMRKRY